MLLDLNGIQWIWIELKSAANVVRTKEAWALNKWFYHFEELEDLFLSHWNFNHMCLSKFYSVLIWSQSSLLKRTFGVQNLRWLSWLLLLASSELVLPAFLLKWLIYGSGGLLMLSFLNYGFECSSLGFTVHRMVFEISDLGALKIEYWQGRGRLLFLRFMTFSTSWFWIILSFFVDLLH